MTKKTVKLVVPTDFEILEAMSDGKRQSAPNLAEILDRDSRYMNNRLSELSAGGLVEKVGPSDRSGMYVITEKGQSALEHQEEYSHQTAEEFDEKISGPSEE
ncbi:ArsR family transcriptional regulator [Halobaculum sp. P14]|uniref:ArsR family transcriptional regulator n=1 Tax=Halobaculum sp. P14 TaxID=3421638 RepID=UPI003EB85FE0